MAILYGSAMMFFERSPQSADYGAHKRWVWQQLGRWRAELRMPIMLYVFPYVVGGEHHPMMLPLLLEASARAGGLPKQRRFDIPVVTARMVADVTVADVFSRADWVEEKRIAAAASVDIDRFLSGINAKDASTRLPLDPCLEALFPFVEEAALWYCWGVVTPPIAEHPDYGDNTDKLVQHYLEMRRQYGDDRVEAWLDRFMAGAAYLTWANDAACLFAPWRNESSSWDGLCIRMNLIWAAVKVGTQRMRRRAWL